VRRGLVAISRDSNILKIPISWIKNTGKALKIKDPYEKVDLFSMDKVKEWGVDRYYEIGDNQALVVKDAFFEDNIQQWLDEKIKKDLATESSLA